MKPSLKLLYTALAATLLLSLAVGGASANRLSLSENQFDIRWGALEFVPSSGSTVRCPVTLLGTFHSQTIRKVINNLIGAVDHAVVANALCVGGRATVLTATLPWHVRYNGFTGTLPNITGVGLTLVGASFRIDNGTLSCLARTDTTDPAGGIANVSGGQVRTLTADSSRTIDLENEGFCAFGSGRFAGTGDVENRRGGLLFISLI